MTIFELNLLGIHIAPSYYGLMYALGFFAGYLILKKRNFLSLKALDDLLLYIFIGVIVGGRLGYILFYNFSYYSQHLLDIFKIWEGGMSFHGGVLGVLVTMIIFSRKNKISFYKIADQVTSVLPIGLGLGRLGNYLNKELLGFSDYNGFLYVEKNGIHYFPSPLIEAIGEGLLLYIILLFIYKRQKFDGQIASVFLIVYATVRLLTEFFFREPDAHIGYIYGYFTVGELLTLPMLIGGIYFYIKLAKSK